MADEVKIDTVAAMRAGAQELGAQLADRTLELAIAQAMNAAQGGRIRELQEQVAVKDAELERMRIVVGEMGAPPATEAAEGGGGDGPPR